MSVIVVCHHNGRVHIVEHDLIGSEQDSHGSDVQVPILVCIDSLERTVCGWTLYEHGLVHDLPFLIKDNHDLHEHTMVRRRFTFPGAESEKAVLIDWHQEPWLR